ncbi:hypothetical protein [uncultured Microbacterium sp.]|uniref:hypothetical protein n=1 Tax=uncultured Microbacterium sp. TaxID=191216 RepID=UPI0028DB40DE|nr:hypothetical protein [uncultured Microbacterium sp.]
MLREYATTPGSQFAAESDLAPHVEAWLQSIGTSCIGREVEVGFGIPDLVGGVGSRQSLRNRRRQSPAVRQALQLTVLEYCHQGRSESQLRDWYGGSFADLSRRALRPLIENQMLTLRNGKYRGRVLPKDPFDRLVAVELKLSDVTRGLAQAHAYRAFAEVSYLALPAHRVTPEVMDRARTVGVGLLAVHLGMVEEVVEPDESSHATTRRRRMASEHTLAAFADCRDRVAGAPRRG